jgi:hypothetical protein
MDEAGDKQGNGMRRGRGHAGETLAEVLVTTTLLGIVGVGVIGAIASILISSDADRQWSHGETVMRSFVAAVERASYVECTSAANPYSSAISFATPRYPDGAPAFKATVENVGTWDGDGPPVIPTAPPSTSPSLTFRPCPSGTDAGLQRLDLRVQHLKPDGENDPRGGDLTSTVYKRDDA